MLHLRLNGISKRFGRQWVLREFNDAYASGEIIGIKGRNGSGKSTLLRILAGQLTPSRGKVNFTLGGQEIPVNERFRHVSWSGPYIEIVEELTIAEFLNFHFRLKPLWPGLSAAELPILLELDHVRNRRLTDCSSGMRQRVLLGSAILANTPLLLLDEPTVTLDETAVAWFHQLLSRHCHDRLVVIASNDAGDLRNCQRVVELR